MPGKFFQLMWALFLHFLLPQADFFGNVSVIYMFSGLKSVRMPVGKLLKTKTAEHNFLLKFAFFG